MGEEKALLEKKGIQLVVIGSGAPHFASGFREKLGTEFAVYSDTRLEVFKALSFQRGLLSALKPQAWKRGVEAFRSGFRQGSVQGDAQQLGGVLGIAADGEVVYRYESQFAGDHPLLADAVEPFPG